MTRVGELPTPFLTDRQRQHILWGDGEGRGGHHHGVVPAPGRRKTWFPRSWSDDEIVEAILHVARTPRVVRDAVGFLNCFGEWRGVRIKVRVNGDGMIVTGHPLDGSGVVQVRTARDGRTERKLLPHGVNKDVAW